MPLLTISFPQDEPDRPSVATPHPLGLICVRGQALEVVKKGARGVLEGHHRRSCPPDLLYRYPNEDYFRVLVCLTHRLLESSKDAVPSGSLDDGSGWVWEDELLSVVGGSAHALRMQMERMQPASLNLRSEDRIQPASLSVRSEDRDASWTVLARGTPGLILRDVSKQTGKARYRFGAMMTELKRGEQVIFSTTRPQWYTPDKPDENPLLQKERWRDLQDHLQATGHKQPYQVKTEHLSCRTVKMNSEVAARWLAWWKDQKKQDPRSSLMMELHALEALQDPYERLECLISLLDEEALSSLSDPGLSEEEAQRLQTLLPALLTTGPEQATPSAIDLHDHTTSPEQATPSATGPEQATPSAIDLRDNAIWPDLSQTPGAAALLLMAHPLLDDCGRALSLFELLRGHAEILSERCRKHRMMRAQLASKAESRWERALGALARSAIAGNHGPLKALFLEAVGLKRQPVFHHGRAYLDRQLSPSRGPSAHWKVGSAARLTIEWPHARRRILDEREQAPQVGRVLLETDPTTRVLRFELVTSWDAQRHLQNIAFRSIAGAHGA